MDIDNSEQTNIAPENLPSREIDYKQGELILQHLIALRKEVAILQRQVMNLQEQTSSFTQRQLIVNLNKQARLLIYTLRSYIIVLLQLTRKSSVRISEKENHHQVYYNLKMLVAVLPFIGVIIGYIIYLIAVSR